MIFERKILNLCNKSQEKVYQEIVSVLGDRDVTIDDLSKFIYLEMVIKETLRRFPVGPLILRRNSEELELSI